MYPNPVHDAANVIFNINRAAKVTVTIYDITGKLVANVYNGEMNSGKTILTINTSNFNTGIYYINFLSNEINKTTKMVVVK